MIIFRKQHGEIFSLYRKVALNLVCRIFLNFAKRCILSFSPKLHNQKNSPCRFLFVAMVAYSVIKMIGQFFDTMILASIHMITSGNNGTSKSTSWKVLEIALSHLMLFFDCYHLRETRFSGIEVIWKAGVIEQKNKNRKKKETSNKKP